MTITEIPSQYSGFDTMPIAGTWRSGTAGRRASNGRTRRRNAQR